MDNVKISREGDELVLRIDLSKDYGPTKTRANGKGGKNLIVANTHGFSSVPELEGATMNLLFLKPVK